MPDGIAILANICHPERAARDLAFLSHVGRKDFSALPRNDNCNEKAVSGGKFTLAFAADFSEPPNSFLEFYRHAGSAECELMASRCSGHVKNYAFLIFYLGKTASTANRTCRFNDFIIAVEVL